MKSLNESLRLKTSQGQQSLIKLAVICCLNCPPFKIAGIRSASDVDDSDLSLDIKCIQALATGVDGHVCAEGGHGLSEAASPRARYARSMERCYASFGSTSHYAAVTCNGERVIRIALAIPDDMIVCEHVGS